MLEYHDEIDTAREVLGKYFTKQPDNPFVLSLFYNFLKRHGDSGEADITSKTLLKVRLAIRFLFVPQDEVKSLQITVFYRFLLLNQK